MQPIAPNPVISSVDDLLVAHDEAFVHLAYVSVLGRPPDREGFTNYLAQLRKGVSKQSLLVDMALSDEGRQHGGNVAGLAALAARKDNPLVRLRDRLSRILSPHAESSREEIRASLNSLHRQMMTMETKTAEVEAQLVQLQATNRNLLGQLLLHIENRAADSGPAAQRATSDPAAVRIVFNLSTSRHWRARVVGIVRVERELAKHLLPFENVCFVYWDPEAGCFMRLSRAETRYILSDGWCDPENGVPADFSAARAELVLDDKDVYVSLGLDWDLTPLHEVAATLVESGCQAVFACHDLVPILFPEFCVDDRFDQKFKRHFIDMAHLATTVFANSDSSRNDLERFWMDSEVNIRLPEIKVVPLANLEPPKRLPKLRAHDTDRVRHLRANGPYVLYVSSIEARKNHRLLIDIWRELYREREQDCPMLVLAGMPGWGVRDLLAQVARMPVHQAGKIAILHDVDDAMLLHLYAHCQFTVFPSYYEGWGLAATESMAFGKACLIADAGGLAQAAQQLMPALHPRDLPGWKALIIRLVDDDAYRQQLEEDIVKRFAHRSWSAFCEDFLAQALPHTEPQMAKLAGKH